ncbi:MAG: FAD-binding protein, partial [Nannocystaceae bacterium]
MMQDASLTHEIWNGWHRQHVRAIVQPASEAEVITAVVQARERGGHVKAIGGRHSFNNISFSGADDRGGDTILDLRRLAQVLHVDRATGLVRVQAGISLWKLVPILAYHGLALPNVGAWMAQTLAGVLATGTHGSGGRHRQSLLGAFRAVRIVDGTGVARALSAHELSFLNLGCFGVVTEVTLACVPLYQCERRKARVHVDDAFEQIPEKLQQHDFVDLRWTGRNRTGLLTTWEINTRPSTKLDRVRSWVEGYLLGAVNLAIAHYPYAYIPQPVTNAVLAGFGVAYTQAAFTGPQNEIWYRSLTFNSKAPIA